MNEIITKEEADLIIGDRYWLDGLKDTSGVFCGTLASGCEGYYFNLIEGRESSYIRNENTDFGMYVGFSNPSGFIKIDPC